MIVNTLSITSRNSSADLYVAIEPVLSSPC
jgi:hypothetical protein